MNLLNIKKLKNKFNELYYKNYAGEIMEFKNDLEKILNDFEKVQNVDKQESSFEKLLKEKQNAENNLDIIKIKEINEKLKELNQNKS